MSARERFLRALIQAMGGTTDLLNRPGVTVLGDAGRAENHVTAGYVLGDHLFVTCDPAVADMLSTATQVMEPTLAEWNLLASELGGELLGGGPMHVLASNTMSNVPMASGYRLQSLHADRPDDLALIERFVAVSTEHDLDEAEIEFDDLDPIIEVALDDSGEIAAYAGSRPFDLVPSFHDLGVLTRPEHRGHGLGRAVIASTCRRLLAAGEEPVYRCEDTNTASLALSAGLGFEAATQLIAYRFPTHAEGLEVPGFRG